MTLSRPGLWATGFNVKHPDLEIDPAYPIAGCRICGAVFQGKFDRVLNPDANVRYRAKFHRDAWRLGHNKKHQDHEHKSLQLSGRQCTPEAAQKLAAYGIFPLSSLVLDEEVSAALAEAPRTTMEEPCM